MPIVARRVVDQHLAGPSAACSAPKARLERRDVAQVRGLEAERGAPALERVGQRLAALAIEVDEADLGALRGEGAHDLLADPRGAAGDEDDGVLQARIAGKGHRGSLPRGGSAGAAAAGTLRPRPAPINPVAAHPLDSAGRDPKMAVVGRRGGEAGDDQGLAVQ